MTVRPRRAGSFFTSRSSDFANVRASASSRSTSSRESSAIEIRCRRSGGTGGSSSSRIKLRTSAIASRFLEQDAVDLVHLDELDLDVLAALGREVLADVVGADRKLAVPAVDEARELDARRASVLEEGLDRRADSAARVEDVVDQDARHALEREVEPRRLDDRLRVERRLAAANQDVVAVERDVERPERDVDAREVLDQRAQTLGERDTTRVDPDQGRPLELGVALDDLVREPRNR